jgi:cytochrome c553
MFVNLLFLLLVIVLTVLFGWMTIRVFRSKHGWVRKIFGGLGAGLLTLVFAMLALTGSKGMIIVYFPNAESAPDMKVNGTPEQILRGEYVVNLGCMGCHGVNRGYPLSGGYNVSQSEGFGFIGDIVAENLTPGGKLANYTDGEIFRAIRHSVDKDGNLLLEMSFLSVRKLSDADIESVIAFLRSQPAAESEGFTGDKINFLGLVLFGSGLFPSPEPVDNVIIAPSAGTTAEYGQYVAVLGGCRTCHGPDVAGLPATSYYPGSPSPRPFAKSVTLDEFIVTMRTGVRPNGVSFSEAMPWQIASMMTDDDLAALYIYMTSNP